MSTEDKVGFAFLMAAVVAVNTVVMASHVGSGTVNAWLWILSVPLAALVGVGLGAFIQVVADRRVTTSIVTALALAAMAICAVASANPTNPGHNKAIADQVGLDAQEYKTITLPYTNGGSFVGDGAPAGYTMTTHPLHGEGTRYRAPEEGPAVVVSGVHWTVGDFGIVGRSKQEKGDPRGVGLLLNRKKSQRGLGTGACEFLPMTFYRLKTGIVLGSQVGTMNSDSSQFRRCDFWDCNTAIDARALMAMGHVFDYVTCHATPTAFRVRAAGDLHVGYFLTTSPCTLFHFTGEGREGPGPNNASYSVRQIKADAQTRGKFTIVQQDHPTWLHIAVDGGRLSGSSHYANLATIRGGTRLVLRNIVASAGATIHTYDQAKVTLEHCRGIEVEHH